MTTRFTKIQFIHNYAGVDNNVFYSRFLFSPGGPVDFKSYWPPKKVTGLNIFAGYTFILIKTGTLYNQIYLFIFRMFIIIDTAAEMTFKKIKNMFLPFSNFSVFYQ